VSGRGVDSGGKVSESAESDRMGGPAEQHFRVRLPNGSIEEGPVVDLRNPTRSEPPALALTRAIRSGCPTRRDAPTVHASPPGSTHAHVARIQGDTTIRTRPALVAAAADLGVETSHDDDLAAALRSLRALSPAPIDDAELREARRRAADAGAETDRLRERAATVRGQVTALREAAVDDATHPSGPDESLAEAEAALSDVTRQLSAVATERVAAAQRLRLLERQARSARDQRNARIRLEDRVENCRRRVRTARVATVSDAFDAARTELRQRIDHGALADCQPDLLDALAVTRIAPIRAPVFVDGDLADALGGPDAAFDRLRAPMLIR